MGFFGVSFERVGVAWGGGGEGPWWEVFMWVMMRFLMAVSSFSLGEAIVGVVDGRGGERLGGRDCEWSGMAEGVDVKVGKA